MRKVIAAAAVALALAAPASAMAHPHFGWGGGWGGWHHGWHHGWGWGAVGLGVGAIAVGEASCYREQPIYNAYGEYVGLRAINVCD